MSGSSETTDEYHVFHNPCTAAPQEFLFLHCHLCSFTTRLLTSSLDPKVRKVIERRWPLRGKGPPIRCSNCTHDIEACETRRYYRRTDSDCSIKFYSPARTCSCCGEVKMMLLGEDYVDCEGCGKPTETMENENISWRVRMAGEWRHGDIVDVDTVSKEAEWGNREVLRREYKDEGLRKVKLWLDIDIEKAGPRESEDAADASKTG